jgi:hypothetical protein
VPLRISSQVCLQRFGSVHRTGCCSVQQVGRASSILLPLLVLLILPLVRIRAQASGFEFFVPLVLDVRCSISCHLVQYFSAAGAPSPFFHHQPGVPPGCSSCLIRPPRVRFCAQYCCPRSRLLQPRFSVLRS